MKSFIITLLLVAVPTIGYTADIDEICNDVEALYFKCDDNGPIIDIDGDGIPNALSDGILIVRYMFGMRGQPLIEDVVNPAGTRTTAHEIEDYLYSITDIVP